jgi:hypothetical protein
MPFSKQEPSMKIRITMTVLWATLAIACFGTAGAMILQGCQSTTGGTATTQPSVDWTQVEAAVQDAAQAYAIVSPYLPAGSEKTTGDTAYAVASATLAKIAADRAAGLPANQADLSVLVPLAAQLHPLIAKATVNKALTAPNAPTAVPAKAPLVPVVPAK